MQRILILPTNDSLCTRDKRVKSFSEHLIRTTVFHVEEKEKKI